MEQHLTVTLKWNHLIFGFSITNKITKKYSFKTNVNKLIEYVNRDHTAEWNYIQLNYTKINRKKNAKRHRALNQKCKTDIKTLFF